MGYKALTIVVLAAAGGSLLLSRTGFSKRRMLGLGLRRRPSDVAEHSGNRVYAADVHDPTRRALARKKRLTGEPMAGYGP